MQENIVVCLKMHHKVSRILLYYWLSKNICYVHKLCVLFVSIYNECSKFFASKKLKLHIEKFCNSSGELAMFSGEKHSANIITVEDCEVMLIQREDILCAISGFQAFCRNIIKRLAKKINALKS